jgi:hypothetical protein
LVLHEANLTVLHSHHRVPMPGLASGSAAFLDELSPDVDSGSGGPGAALPSLRSTGTTRPGSLSCRVQIICC